MASLGLYLNETEYAELKSGKRTVITADAERLFIQSPDGNYVFAEIQSVSIGKMYGSDRQATMVLVKEK